MRQAAMQQKLFHINQNPGSYCCVAELEKKGMKKEKESSANNSLEKQFALPIIFTRLPTTCNKRRPT